MPHDALSLLWSRPEGPTVGRLLLAHGAGVGQDSAFLMRLTAALVAQDIAVARFEFGYMAARRTTGKKAPPPKAELLVGEYRAALDLFLEESPADLPAIVAGKSMGGRVAVLAAGEPLPPAVSAIVVFGYPFHPQGKPDDWRLAPLEAATAPVLILQGERDEFGSAAEVVEHPLPPSVSIVWIEDGSHDFGPRGASPASLRGNIEAAATATRAVFTGGA